MVTGTLYGLGIGPGDPDLITVKALRILQAAPVIAYPAPEQGDSLARAIAAPHLDAGPQPADGTCHRIEIVMRMPMVADRFPAQQVYDQAAADIGGHLAAGRDVAVLCEGDPFFYGSFMYLFGRMAPRFRVEVVPGVSSVTACAAALGAPLAARNDVLTVLPAPLGVEALRAALNACDAAAIIKLGRHFAMVRDLLAEMGLTGHAHYIERATMDRQDIRPIDAVDPATVPYFSMLLVHKRSTAWSL